MREDVIWLWIMMIDGVWAKRGWKQFLLKFKNALNNISLIPLHSVCRAAVMLLLR